MRPRTLLLLLPFWLSAVLSPSAASVVALRSDADLVREARAIIVGTVVDTFPRIDSRSGLIQTVAQVAVEQVAKGRVDRSEISVAEWGGQIGDSWLIASGAPRYHTGQRVLIFLDVDRNGDWTTLAMSLGSFRFERDGVGTELLVRDEGDLTVIGGGETGKVRRADLFVDYVRGVARGEEPAADYFTTAAPTLPTVGDSLVVPDYAGSQYAMVLGGLPTRRDNAAVSWRIWGSQPGLDLSSSVSRAVSAWNSGGSPLISYSKSSQPASGSNVASDGESRIIGNDPNGDISGSCNSGTCTVAVCYFGGSGSHEFNGETFFTLNTSDIIVNDGVSALGQQALDTAMTHEMGHSLGFRHSDRTPDESGSCGPPLPCSTTAIMNSYVVSGIGASLQSWDIDAVRTLYGSAAACTAPTITTPPKSATVISGGSVTLSIIVAGTSPVAVQWYRGARGDTSAPVGNGSLTYTTGPLTATAMFWVQATNSCGTASSDTATLTVCYPPVITSQPAGASIRSGQSATLSIGVTGASTIQWYRGATGDTSSAIVGASSPVLVTPPLLSTTLFWARVANSCTGVNSTTARVDVCTPPQIVEHPQSQTVRRGDSATLSVTYTGSEPATYAWYQGTYPDTSKPAGTGNPLVTPLLSTQTSYWVLVQNACGDAHSVTAVISIAEDCIPPAITRQPAGQNVALGGSALLSVTATGTGLSYQWYRGPGGDRTTPVGINSPALVTESLTATTTYWVRVYNSCGERSSAAATVNAIPCEAPRIVVQPANTTIDSSRSATLLVSAMGDEPLAYQWFEGTAGDVTYPVGFNSPSFTTPTLVRTTNYWVRVTNGCSSTDSVTANVLVLGGHPRGRGVKK